LSPPWVRTSETNSESPKAPSQAVRVKKIRTKFLKLTIDLTQKRTPKIISIKPSKLSKVARRCLRLEINLKRKINMDPINKTIKGLTKDD
jgi:hypothetical protein